MFNLINQPFNGQLGAILQDKLINGQFCYFTMMSAFAKNSGVLRMKEAIRTFKENGGRVDAFIGVDALGTSYEALLNLFLIVNNLYIIHDSNPTMTFHSKMYYLSDEKEYEWLAIGSNNLTGGGLWTNYESACIVDTCNPVENGVVNVFKEHLKLMARYKMPECEYSKKIESEDDIRQLLDADIIRREIRLHIETRERNRLSGNRKSIKSPNIFGTQGSVSIPHIKREPAGDQITVNWKKETITPIERVKPSDSSERMWFETRAMTGGSRNILDLSMIGNLIEGSGNGTRYETDDNTVVLGGIAFFDINPTDYKKEKDVTINYEARDFAGCKIKFATNNGSWRIQLKGETASGDKLTSAEDGEWFVHKIIVLEKIKTDYYVMSVLEESELPSLIDASYFVAQNGSSTTSKRYGLLHI